MAETPISREAAGALHPHRLAAPPLVCACHGLARGGLYTNRLFPWLMDKMLSREDVEAQRSRLLEPVSGHVLEVGFGTGLNLFHYTPELTSLTAIDNNPGMLDRARPRLKRVDFPVHLRPADLQDLPMQDATFDAVVCTFTLCSVQNPEAGLAEILRVLKPGGWFYLLEHGLASHPRAQRWQRRLNPLQRRLAGGCQLDRDIPGLVAAAGFAGHHIETDRMARVPSVFGTLFAGRAQRAAKGDPSL